MEVRFAALFLGLALAGSATSQPRSAFCERAPDGSKIARIQTEVNALDERLRAEPAFAWANYEHAPCYWLVLAFTDGRTPAWLRAAASPELRAMIRVVQARLPLSNAAFEQARQEIAVAIAPARVKAVMFVSPSEQLIQIGVISEADAQLVRSVIPVRHRAITRVIPGGYTEPIPERG